MKVNWSTKKEGDSKAGRPEPPGRRRHAGGGEKALGPRFGGGSKAGESGAGARKWEGLGVAARKEGAIGAPAPAGTAESREGHLGCVG